MTFRCGHPREGDTVHGSCALCRAAAQVQQVPMKGVHFIDLGQWPPALYLIANKRAYSRFTKRHCGKYADRCQPFPSAGGGGCQKMIDGPNCIFVITIGPHHDDIERAASLAHEATHAMRWILEYVGERKPGTETQAYLVEHIVKNGLKALAA